MNLVRGAWKILVAIKDGLVLIFMLIFFTLLFTALSARPNKAAGVRDGALVIALDGALVEQPESPDPFAAFGGGGDAVKQVRLRDVTRALDEAAKDSNVKVVVLDMDRFMGGYPAAVNEVAAAVGRVRSAGKPVLSYATAYFDDSYQIAAHASEIWVNPMGGTLFAGPGGPRLYYKGLLDKLGVTTHVYKVGKYKSAVEPYIRTDMSPEAREANQAMVNIVLSEWQADIARARPKAKVADYLTKPDDLVVAAQGDLAKANLTSGLIDKTGDRLAFGKRVAEIAGEGSTKRAGNFKAIRLADYLEAKPASVSGDQIGVITVAGEIVDGKAGAGTAGGDTIAGLVLEGLAEKKLKALVVRIDSPGGSAMASERIRQAILQAKAQKLPVVISMGSLAASGGYWVATAGDTIFADRGTITGSIGIFGLLPTFEGSLAKLGLSADGVQTTPLSGQPDLYRGTNPVVDRILQSSIEQGYSRFINLVAGARKLTTTRVDEIGQGRVWMGLTAQQLGLVDKFGGLNDAIAEAARQAKLDPAKVHAVYLEKAPSGWKTFFAGLADGDDKDDDWADSPSGDDAFARLAAERRSLLAQALGDARRLAVSGSVQARCFECVGFGPATPSRADLSLLELMIARLGG